MGKLFLNSNKNSNHRYYLTKETTAGNMWFGYTCSSTTTKIFLFSPSSVTLLPVQASSISPTSRICFSYCKRKRAKLFKATYFRRDVGGGSWSWGSGHLGGLQTFRKTITWHGLVLWEQRGKKGGIEPQFLMQLALTEKSSNQSLKF